MNPLALSALLAIVIAFAMPLSAAATISSNISRPADAPAKVKLAAQEIRRYVYLRTGALLPITADNGAITLRVDGALPAEQFRLKSDGTTLAISGGSDLAVLYGAYAFVEKLGVRFYLDSDIVPDERVPFALPVLDETATPAFAIRGILPFHDFPEGPDLWATDDYKAVLAQMVKLRMNFIGLHTYTETGWGSEPTVWLGLPEDIDEQGHPRFSYGSYYFNTARHTSGHAPRRVADMLFGGSLLCESEPWGPPVMAGLMPQGNTLEEKNQLFIRSGEMLRDAFSYAQRFGVKTCVGTEIPLTHPTRLLPNEVRARLAAQGRSVADPATRRALYAGTFLRALRTYPLDYYWLWTPEGWRGPQSDEEVEQTRLDLQAAVEAAREVKAPFTLATAGWVMGPLRDRALFDKLLPKEMPFAALNLELGTVPVDEGFARLQNRAGWAIPWMEDDLSMSSPQLWVGRIRRDAYDAHRLGCQGLIGIHWRTAEVGPMVSALAQAQWQVPQVTADAGLAPDILVAGGGVAAFGAPVAATECDPIYQDVRFDVSGYDLAMPNGRYRVTLQFNEPFYDAPGKRIFGVVIQGRTVIDRLDIFARVGKNTALDLAFDEVEVSDGRLKVTFLKDLASQLIGADKAAAEGKYIALPCIAGLIAAGPAKTVKLNCGGPAWQDYVADPGEPQIPRYLPVGDFYLDWARHQFGEAAAPEIAAIFSRIDGHLPAPAPYCPGGIVVNGALWSSAQGAYAFVEELAALRPRIKGAGNQARFEMRVKSFEYLRAIGRVACTRGELDRAMTGLNGKAGPQEKKTFARDTVLPVRLRLNEDWGRMMTLCLETADTWGSIGHVFTHEMFNRGELKFLEVHDPAIGQALGDDAAVQLVPTAAYQGQPRLIVPTHRSVAEAGEALPLKVIVLDNQPVKSAVLRWRPLGQGEWQAVPLRHVARAVYTVTLPPLAGETREYYIEAETAAGMLLRWPATAPTLSQTVVSHQ